MNKRPPLSVIILQCVAYDEMDVLLLMPRGRFQSKSPVLIHEEAAKEDRPADVLWKPQTT
jgi:hypothetical protein